MRILANENFPEEAVVALRKRGHDVVWIRTDIARAAVAALESRSDWAGNFAVVEEHRIRMRSLLIL